jgi:hypothetical protein
MEIGKCHKLWLNTDLHITGCWQGDRETQFFLLKVLSLAVEGTEAGRPTGEASVLVQAGERRVGEKSHGLLT